MRLHELIKIKSRSKKRLGRGVGSGKGKTGGRGTKGQKARGKIPIGFSGNLSLYKKLPKRRGLGNPKLSASPKPITISSLNVFPKKATIDLEQLLASGVIDKKDAMRGVKILAGGELKKALTIKLPVSKAARQKLEKVGGKVDYA